MDQNEQPERQLNIHFTPEEMAGHYANFANVSHSDYEFTITFARVDHEFDGPIHDNYDKWSARESIRDLPEVGDDHLEA